MSVSSSSSPPVSLPFAPSDSPSSLSSSDFSSRLTSLHSLIAADSHSLQDWLDSLTFSDHYLFRILSHSYLLYSTPQHADIENSLLSLLRSLVLLNPNQFALHFLHKQREFLTKLLNTIDPMESNASLTLNRLKFLFFILEFSKSTESIESIDTLWISLFQSIPDRKDIQYALFTLLFHEHPRIATIALYLLLSIHHLEHSTLFSSLPELLFNSQSILPPEIWEAVQMKIAGKKSGNDGDDGNVAAIESGVGEGVGGYLGVFQQEVINLLNRGRLSFQSEELTEEEEKQFGLLGGQEYEEEIVFRGQWGREEREKAKLARIQRLNELQERVYSLSMELAALHFVCSVFHSDYQEKFFYTNDVQVLIEILTRKLLDGDIVGNNASLFQYLLSVEAVLNWREYLNGNRYGLSELDSGIRNVRGRIEELMGNPEAVQTMDEERKEVLGASQEILQDIHDTIQRLSNQGESF